MSWASFAIARLQAGETVTIRPHGNSMVPLVYDGDTVTVAPLQSDPEAGDVVLVRCRGADYLHLIRAKKGSQYQIGNNRGRINGWVTRNAIFGKMNAKTT